MHTSVTVAYTNNMELLTIQQRIALRSVCILLLW